MRRFLLLFFMSGMLLSWSMEVRAETKPTLAILPFLIERIDDPSRGAVCPVCQGVYKRGNILSGSQRTLTQLLQQKMDTLETSRFFLWKKWKISFPKRIRDSLN